MTNNIDRAAELLSNEGCVSEDTAYFIARLWADAGLLAPDLPELSESSEAGVTAFGQVYIRYGVDDLHMTTAEAREVAYDLLAAADHAEEASHAQDD